MKKTTGISISKTSLTMNIFETRILTACAKPSDTGDRTVIWSSDNEDVASVSAGGAVYAKSSGFAEITARTKDGEFYQTCTIKVVNSYNPQICPQPPSHTRASKGIYPEIEE